MKLSIITINYNNKQGLEETINSVIAQNFSDYEYIIIDGGSNDGSKDVILKYSDKISYWVSEPDRGIYHAMNKGIQKANGEYLHFLNSGDVYYNSSVLKSIFNNRTYNTGIIRGIQIIKNKEGNVEWHNHGNKRITFYDLYWHTIQHQSTFISKNLFKKYGLYDENYKIISDWLFFAQLILNDEKTEFVNIPVVLFDTSGISTINVELSREEKSTAMRKLLPESIILDYERLDQLENEIKPIYHDPIYNFYKNNKLPMFILRTLRQIYKIFKII